MTTNAKMTSEPGTPETLDTPSDNIARSFEDLIEPAMELGHRMAISEMLATVIYNDRSKSSQVCVEYGVGYKKVIVDLIAKHLRAAGWKHRKVMRWGSRRVRWVDPSREEDPVASEAKQETEEPVE